MLYFKNENGSVYAYTEDDVTHDTQVRARIAALESARQTLSASENYVETLSDDATLEKLYSSLRISKQLTPISEQEAQQLVAPSPEEMDDQTTKAEHGWVQSELEYAQIELMYHWTDDERASFTLEVWKQYTRDLRNYTTTDDSGIISVVGDTRPSRPY
ncbi:hypothetical protein [Vibrio furnissii]|uniref:hypothetical protein n=1 Tax=Vibrio furnissii TaxID=29494 RepID=UPI00130251F7|nr:hypothetical protein [Vibrio furnissii]